VVLNLALRVKLRLILKRYLLFISLYLDFLSILRMLPEELRIKKKNQKFKLKKKSKTERRRLLLLIKTLDSIIESLT